MTTTKVFQSGNSQAVRIPKELRTEKKEFFIKRVGDAYILFPVDDPWFPSLTCLSGRNSNVST